MSRRLITEASGRKDVAWKDLVFLDCLGNEDWVLEHNVEGLDKIPEMRSAIDIGAHVGFTSLPAARRGATVLAFEPNPWSYSHLVRNIYHNKLEEKVYPFQLAVADRNGLFKHMRQIPDSPGQTSMLYRQGIPLLGVSYTVSLNSILKFSGPVDYLKIDTEGAEYEILMSCRPMFLGTVKWMRVEMHDVNDPNYFNGGPTMDDLKQFLVSNGFENVEGDIWKKK